MKILSKKKLNVKTVEWADSSNDYIEYKLKLNFKTACPRLGKVVNEVNQLLNQTTSEKIDHFLNKESLTVKLKNGEVVYLGKEDIIVQKTSGLNGYAEASNRNFTVIIDINISEELRREGTARDFIRGVQDLAKKWICRLIRELNFM